MFAVIKTGGKQYRVKQDDVITIDRLATAPGETVLFAHVLMLGGDAGVTMGSPVVSGATVAAEVVEATRAAKVIAFKKRRRQNSKRKRGHRQHLTIVRIAEILTNGAKPTMTAKPAVSAAPVALAAVSAPAGTLDASNLSLIAGIGPTIEKKLRAAGITSWNDIAAWTDEDLEKWDKELALRGRATREEWVAQAKELLDGKPPRAKVDQAEKASGKDL
jgi:large subunit ribosomal protein L21